MLQIIAQLLPFAQEQPQRLWDRLQPDTRAQLLMVLVGFLVLLAGLYVLIRLGGRWARRTEPHESKDSTSSTAASAHSASSQPRTFLKPLSEEEARLAVPVPGSKSAQPDDAPDESASDETDG